MSRRTPFIVCTFVLMSALASVSAFAADWPPAIQLPSASPRPPALAAFNGTLYAVWLSPNRTIIIASRNASGAFDRPHPINTVDSSFDTPAIAQFNDKLCLAWRANDQSRGVYISCTNNPAGTWPNGGRVNAVSDGTPALVTFKKELHLFWRGQNHQFFVASSKNGDKWKNEGIVDGLDFSTEVPAVAEFKDKLYIAFKANDQSNEILVTSTKKAKEWPKASRIKTHDSTPHRPALVATDTALTLAWTGDNIQHQLYVSSSTNGKDWNTSVANPTFVSNFAPALAMTGSETCMAWTAANNQLRYSCAR